MAVSLLALKSLTPREPCELFPTREFLLPHKGFRGSIIVTGITIGANSFLLPDDGFSSGSREMTTIPVVVIRQRKFSRIDMPGAMILAPFIVSPSRILLTPLDSSD
jgi:hypothetical protein